MVGFDEEALVLGIKPYQGEENIKGYPFASRIKNGWVRIGCKDFIKYLGNLMDIDFSKAHKYVAESDRDAGCLIVRLQHEDKKCAIINDSH